MSVELYLLLATAGMIATFIFSYHFMIKPRLYTKSNDSQITGQTVLTCEEQILRLDISGDTPILTIPAEFGFNEVCEVRVRKNEDGSLLIVPTLTF